MILLAAIPLGLLIGVLAGGHIRSIGSVHIRGEWLLAILLVLQLALPAMQAKGASVTLLYWGWLLTYPMMAGVCILNRRAPGMLVAGAGLGLNALVIAINHGMPVSLQAVHAAGGALSALPLAAQDFVHNLAGPATRLPALGDVIPVSGAAALRSVASTGDLLLSCGVATVLARAMVAGKATVSSPA